MLINIVVEKFRGKIGYATVCLGKTIGESAFHAKLTGLNMQQRKQLQQTQTYH